jgi:hypothetical protein
MNDALLSFAAAHSARAAFQDRVPIPLLLQVRPDHVHGGDRDVEGEVQARSQVIQPSEGTSPLFLSGPPEGDMRVEGPGLPFEAVGREAPLQILLQTPKGGGWIRAKPEDLRPADGRKGAEPLEAQRERPRGSRHPADGLGETWELLPADVAEKLEGQMEAFRIEPVNRHTRLPQGSGRLVDQGTLGIGKIEGKKQSHGPPGAFG